MFGWLLWLKRKQRVWTFPLLVYVVLLHYLFLLCKMTTRPIWLGTQGDTGVDAGPALLSLVRVSAGWCSFLSPASQTRCKPKFVWGGLHLTKYTSVFNSIKTRPFLIDCTHIMASCWELGRGTQIEWPGCILICGAVLFLGLMGVRLVWSLPCCTKFSPLRVSLCPLYSQNLHVW